MNSAFVRVRPGYRRFVDSIFEALPPTRRNPDPRRTIHSLTVGFGVVDALSCAPAVGDIWLHITDDQCVAHGSVWRSDIKLSVPCGGTPATLDYSESEICAAT